MPVLLDHPCCVVAVDPVRGILRFTRTEQPYGSLEEVVEVHHRIGKIFDRMGRERHMLLVDMRRAPLNNRPDFEHAAARARRILVRDFRRLAVLVETAVGALQVGRHMREDGVPGDVFTSEAQALEYLARNEIEAAPSSGVSRAGRDGEPGRGSPNPSGRRDGEPSRGSPNPSGRRDGEPSRGSPNPSGERGGAFDEGPFGHLSRMAGRRPR